MKKLARPPRGPADARALKECISDIQLLVDENYSALGGRENQSVPSMIAASMRKHRSGAELTKEEARAFKLAVEMRLLEALRRLEPPD